MDFFSCIMAIFKIVKESTHDVYLWKVEESVEQLVVGLTFRAPTQIRLAAMKSEVHKKGFLAVRHLLAQAGYTDFDLLYDDNGKPYLKDGKHISISHSFEFACIIISKYNVGIDIEQKREKIQRIASKFVNQEEADFYNTFSVTETVDYLTRVWCVKEVLFKMCNSRSLSFKDNMQVSLNAYNSLSGFGVVNQGDFNLQVASTMLDLGDFILAYSIEL